MPNYEPGKPYYLSSKTMNEMLSECSSRWAYLWLKDGRKMWVKIRKVTRRKVSGTAVRNGRRENFSTSPDNVETMVCK
jgi:hypothetical protein